MGSNAPSAGDHQWRAITVHIHPGLHSSSVTVVCRRMKGIECLWQRRILSKPVEGLTLDDDPSVHEALELVAAVLAEALDRTQEPPESP